MNKKRTIQKVVLPGQTPKGEHILSVLVKRSYDIIPGEQCVRTEIDQKLISGDVHYDGPMNSSVKFEADFIPYKIATDVVLNGKAYAPKEKPVKELIASLMVGRFRKDIRVIGDRLCIYRRFRELMFTDPKPFADMDIRYELAYGGVDIYSEPTAPCAYPRNHLGRGFVVGKSKKAIDNLRLPNIEDPRNLLTPEHLFAGEVKNWEIQPMPQGFGWFSKYWYPRASLAGIMPADRPVEQELREAYASVLPPELREEYEDAQLPDMDFRFFNGASRGLALPFLAGDEVVRLLHLDPEREISFQLPGERPNISLDIGMGPQQPDVFLHTVMIRMEERQVDMVWRGAVPYPGTDWLPKMKKMDVIIR